MGLGLIAGAMQGAGDAGVAAGLQAQKQFGEQDLLKMRADAEQELARTQATLAQQTHAANTDTDIAAIPRRGAAETEVLADRADKVPQTLKPGEVITKGGKVTVQAPAAPLAPELAEYYKGHANYMNSYADAIKDKYGKQLLMPNIVEVKSADGTTTHLLDKNTGMIGTVVPGEPARAAIKHWLSADEPARAQTPDLVMWTDQGRPTPAPLDYHPAYVKTRAKLGLGGAEAGAPAQPGTPAPAAPVRVSTPPQGAIDLLRKDPSDAAKAFFDKKYPGSGGAAKYLVAPAPAAAAAKPAAKPAGIVNKQVRVPEQAAIEAGHGETPAPVEKAISTGREQGKKFISNSREQLKKIEEED